MEFAFGSSSVQVKFAIGSSVDVIPKLSPIQGQLQSVVSRGSTRPVVLPPPSLLKVSGSPSVS